MYLKLKTLHFEQQNLKHIKFRQNTVFAQFIDYNL